jgi:hypothetical protein
VCTLVSEPERDCAPDSGAAPGDDGDPVLQPHRTILVMEPATFAGHITWRNR